MPRQRDEQGKFTEQLKREFPLFTNGEMPDLDLICIVGECIIELDAMPENTRSAAIDYLKVRFF